jgi:hypothetical protein
VHEVENLFLHPDGIALLLQRIDGNPAKAKALLVDEADRFAGGWVFQRTYDKASEHLPAATPQLKEFMWGTTWQMIQSDVNAIVARACSCVASGSNQVALDKFLRHSVEAYRKLRDGDVLWRECMGKQVLPRVAQRLGYAGPEFFEQSIVAAWKSKALSVPREVTLLREYVTSLSADGSVSMPAGTSTAASSTPIPT